MVTGLLSEADSCPNLNIRFSDNSPLWTTIRLADSCPNLFHNYELLCQLALGVSDNSPFGGLLSEYNCTSACEHLTRIIVGRDTIVRRVGMRI